MAALKFHRGEPFGQRGALLERFERAPKRFLEDVRLRAEHRFGREGVTDPAAEAGVLAVSDLPEHAAAVGTGERRRIARAILRLHRTFVHFRNFLFHVHLLQAGARNGSQPRHLQTAIEHLGNLG